MFDEHYTFRPGVDILLRVDDVTPADGNREHKHTHVEQGLDSYTANWECVASSTERRRGSDRLYLVDDTHYVHCSRTGMERSGNSVWLSAESPADLQFAVASGLFEGVVERQGVTIGDGVDKAQLFDNDGLSITSPRAFVLANECSQDEITAYYDEVADLFIDLISRYHDADTVADITTAVEHYRAQRTDVFREYTNFTPSTVSQVINNGLVGINGWDVPEELDPGDRTVVIMHENGAADGLWPTISITFDTYLELGATVDGEDRTIKETTFESATELRELLTEYMEITPDTIRHHVSE